MPISSESCVTQMWSRGRLESRVRAGQEEAGAKFSDYFDFAEAFTRLPSHRILALFRGEKEEILNLSFAPEVAADRCGGTTGRIGMSRGWPGASPSRTAAGRLTVG